MNAEGSAEEPSAGAEQSDPEPRHLARRSLLTAAGVVGVAGVAAVSGGLVWRDDVANARQHADGATTAELSTATSLKVLWRANTTHKVMALTFDDGPGPTLTSPLLDVLAENKVRATFSLVGRRAHLRKDLVRRQMRQGHELANHTWSHQDLSQIGPAAQQRELESTDQILYDLTGRKPAVIRPPYGRINGDLLAYAARNAQQIVLWDMRFHESLVRLRRQRSVRDGSPTSGQHPAWARCRQSEPLCRDPSRTGHHPYGQGQGIRVPDRERDVGAGRQGLNRCGPSSAA